MLERSRAHLRLLSGLWGPFGWFLLSLAVTAAAVWMGVRITESNDRARFEARVDEAQGQLEDIYSTYEMLLQATAGLFEEDTMPDADFHRFVARIDPIEKVEALSTIGFASEQDGRFQIDHIEPRVTENVDTFLADLSDDPALAGAVRRAKELGRPVSTPLMTLPRTWGFTDVRAGFVMVVPVHAIEPTTERSTGYRGVVFGIFASQPFLDAVSKSGRVSAKLNRVRADPSMDEGNRTGLWARRTMDVGGEVWTLDFVPGPSFTPPGTQATVPLIFMSGLAVSFGLFLFTSARARAQASAAANRATLELARSREALERSERKLVRLVDANIVGIAIGDPRGAIQEANEAFLQLVGYSRDDLSRGLVSWQVLTPPELRFRDLRALDDLKKLGSHAPIEKELIRKDGSRVPVLVGSALLDENDHLALGFVLDITEQKRADAERAKLLALEAEARIEAQTLNRIGRSLAAELDLHKLLQGVTDAATHLIGAQYGAFYYTSDDAKEWSTLSAFSGAAPEAHPRLDRPEVLDLIEPIQMTQGCVRIDDVSTDLREDGAALYAALPSGGAVVRSYLAAPVVSRSGEALGALLFGHTEAERFTERHERIVMGIAAQAAVAIDNARLYQTAEEARRSAEVANRAKDEFLAVLSHELRTPLTPVTAALQMLSEHREVPDSLRPVLEIVQRNIEVEARLIDDLLDLNRIVRGKLQLNVEVIDAHVTISNVLDVCRNGLAAKRLTPEVELLAEHHAVRADPARLSQVLWNIVQNAVKFTPPEHRVVIRTTNVGMRLRIEVRDEGIGIEPDILPRIFDAFEQGSPSITRRFGGMGLGLALSKVLVNLHGGAIWAESPGRGMGSILTVELDTVREPMLTRDAVAAATQNGGQRRPLSILLVDDHQDTLALMKLLLEKRGYAIHTAVNVEDALSVAQNEDFDLVISDIGLPDESGLTLFSRLRAHREVKGIAMSGFGRQLDIERSKQAGFAEHLTKPVNIQQLDGLIQRMFG